MFIDNGPHVYYFSRHKLFHPSEVFFRYETLPIKPHFSFTADKQQSIRVDLDVVERMVEDKLTAIIKIRFHNVERQQNFLSIWWGDYDRIVLEMQRGGILGIYTPISRQWRTIVQPFRPGRWYTLL